MEPVAIPLPPLSPNTNTITTTTPKPAATSLSPVIIHGKYLIERLLGRGSFAKVYRARNLLDNSSVAIKAIDKTKTSPSTAHLILREVDAMRRLKHPNILQIHEVLATKSKIYLAMELARGGDLFARLYRRPNHRVPEPHARRYFHQLVSALNYCHMNGIAHRDMKPHNILLDEQGNIKITDFGLSAVATTRDELELLKTACGTPAFAAPEVVGRWKSYDGTKADAWSCGVILYAMVAGKLPFDDRNQAVMYMKMQRRDVQFPIHVTRPARALICKLLDPNPERRLSTEGIVNDPWYKSGQSCVQRGLSLGDLVVKNAEKLERKGSSGINAFDIISMSSGLNLSGLFDGSSKRCMERRFTTKESMELIMEKVVDVGVRLGYEVEKGKGGRSVWFRKLKSVLIVEALEAGEDVLVVELRVVDCGGGNSGGIEETQWGELKTGLGDQIAITWHEGT